MTDYAYAVKDTSVWETIDYEAMSQESYAIAIQVYDGITEDAVVSEEYQDKWRPVIYERLNIGGHRLYYALNYIFGDSTEIE